MALLNMPVRKSPRTKNEMIFFPFQIDADMAQSAIRNLHGFEFGNRSLRVDKASSQADELRLLHQQTTIGAPTFEPTQSVNITPDKIPEVIARTLGKFFDR